MNLKRGDNVKMLAGKDRGKSGKISRIDVQGRRVMVENLNLIKKHVRPRRQGETGQVIEVARYVDVSNVQLVCAGCGKTSRVGFKMEKGKKVRFCKRCNTLI